MVKILKKDEKKYAVLLRDDGEVLFVEKQEGLNVLANARKHIGCDWIEVVYPQIDGFEDAVMLIDEEGKLNGKYVNPIACAIYGSDKHGDPIVGNALIMASCEDDLEYMNGILAAQTAKSAEQLRSRAFEWAIAKYS